MKKTLLLAGVLVTAAANAQISIQASTAAFIDISTATSVGTISDDSENSILPNWGGNGLVAGGVTVRVGNNGGILWGTSAGDTFLNCDQVGYINASGFGTTPNPLASMTSSNAAANGNGAGLRQFFAVLWDDNTPGTGGSTTWAVVGNDLIIQWTNEDHFNATGSGVITYQAQFHGGVSIASGLSLVDFVYQDTQYAPNQYQNDGGSSTIGYKNWGLNALANDVEWGNGGGTNSLSDPAFGDASMQPKVAGYLAADNPNLTHAVKIVGPVPEPGTMAALGLGALALIRKRRAK